ncbi:hypothetical protein EAG_01537 [Camponotus floridanus]|uniref:Uncharacterized protein n=1 Tax=Camponotus floridanus TaxID=104421 RepID=E2AVS5_CAMFO|nr:hypothetical protein EAG_01537 [Camponotus floridanus]
MSAILANLSSAAVATRYRYSKKCNTALYTGIVVPLPRKVSSYENRVTARSAYFSDHEGAYNCSTSDCGMTMWAEDSNHDNRGITVSAVA